MTSEETKAFVRRYFDAFRKDKSPATLDRYISEQPLKEHIAFFEAALPGYWLEAEDMVVEGDKVAVRMTVHGTHKGDLMGVAPTGKQVSFPGIIIYRIVDGKIAEHWMQVDMVSLLQQLGAMPAPAH